VAADERTSAVTTSTTDENAPQPSAAAAEPSAAEPSETPSRPAPRGRRPLTRLAFLAFGLLVALYLGTQGPHEQHVRIVLGAAAAEVTAVDLQYIALDGDVVREAHFAYPNGAAPRIVAHELQLPNGDYRLQIDVDARDGRRGIQRQVTLGGGSTQVDVSSALARETPPP
jgi:hypothetical protein